MVLGTVMALAHGTALPILLIIFGDMSDAFITDAKFVSQLPEVVANLSSICQNKPGIAFNCSIITVDFLQVKPEENLR